jgi:hypothetical protein
MTEKREHENGKQVTPRDGLESDRRTAGTNVRPATGRDSRLALVPEGVDREFWPLWRAHVLAGIGMITGYSLGIAMQPGDRGKTE